MKVSNGKKWQAVLSHEFDDNLADRPFSARLAEENGWTEERANRVLLEYRRFAYLCSISENGEMTPSVDVDEAWHLHLAYTRNYWGPFAAALGRPLHHGPSPGGGDADEHYAERYEATLEAYRREFGPPPPDIWPPADVRFSPASAYLKLSPEVVAAIRSEVDGNAKALEAKSHIFLAAFLMAAAPAGILGFLTGSLLLLVPLSIAFALLVVGGLSIDDSGLAKRFASRRNAGLGAPAISLAAGLLIVPPVVRPQSEGGTSGSSCGSVASCGSGCGGGGGCGG